MNAVKPPDPKLRVRPKPPNDHLPFYHFLEFTLDAVVSDPDFNFYTKCDGCDGWVEGAPVFSRSPDHRIGMICVNCPRCGGPV